jgi:phage shock protein PspC (stress-responsive transcriptional regulator)
MAESSESTGNDATKKLYRDSENGMLGGVCQGFSEVYDVDVNLCRILAVFFGVPYLIAWAILPEKEELEEDS